MTALTSSDTIVLFLAVAVLLTAARIAGEIARKLNQPSVLGELIAGIVLGPSVLGAFWPEATAYLFPTSGPVAVIFGGLRVIAIVLFLLVAGMEVELSTVWRQGRSALWVGLAGIGLPFSLGVLISWALPDALGREANVDPMVFGLFIGTAMSISALPVIARTLMDLRLYRTNLGMVVIAAAVLDDLAGWTFFAAILGLMGRHASGLSVLPMIAAVLAFAIGVLTVGRWAIHRVLPWIQAHTTWPVGVLSLATALVCLSAALTEWIGIHAIFGAFLIGVAIGDSTHLREHTRTTMSDVVSFFFAPLFFAGIGLRVDFVRHFDWRLTAVVIVVACAAKIVGCTFGALRGGVERREALAVGFAMNARGAMEIILGLLALQAGLIGERLFVSLVVMALFTSVISGPLIRWTLKLSRTKGLRDYMFAKAFIPELRAGDRVGAIRELAEVVASVAGLNAPEVAHRVLQREELMPTGIGHRIAVPHARFPGLTAPIVGLGLAKSGIDFDAPDGEPAQLVFLILAPPHDDGAQVAILAEIARRFAGDEPRRAALAVQNFTQFLALMKMSTERHPTSAIPVPNTA